MSYRFEHGEPVETGIKRIIHEQIDQAVESLQGYEENRDEAVHDARKRFKKIRAALRLVRDDIGSEAYQRENAFYRDQGRRLAEMRDAFVLRGLTAQLLEDEETDLPEESLNRLHEQLNQAYERRAQKAFEEMRLPVGVAATLAEQRERIDALPVESEDFEALQGLRRVYKRGYKGMKRAYKEPTAGNFHEWRKRVKYLWYHTRILEPVWPPIFEVLADEVHELANILGDLHDWTELQAVLEGAPGSELDGDGRQALLGALRQREETLQAQARPLGARIYAEKPDRFMKRMAAYWRAYESRPSGARTKNSS